MFAKRQEESLVQLHMPQEIARDVEAFLEHLRQELGTNLLSVVAFGSSATGEYVHWKTSVNLLILVQKLGPADLEKAANVALSWLRRFPLDPVLMTADDLARSQDVFPVEFVDMFHRHCVLWGEHDPLSDLEIDGSALRVEVEHSLRKKLLRLRGHFLRVANNERALTDLMTESIEEFLQLMSSLLFLHGKQPPSRVLDLCTQLHFTFDLDGSTLIALADVKYGRRSLKRGEALELFERYLRAVERMVDNVDRMDSHVSG